MQRFDNNELIASLKRHADNINMHLRAGGIVGIESKWTARGKARLTHHIVIDRQLVPFFNAKTY